MVMKALYLQRPEFSRDQDDRVTERYRALYPSALAKFMDAHGGIEDSFYADRIPAGVVLTGSGELFFSMWWDVFRFDTTVARELEAEVNELHLPALALAGEVEDPRGRLVGEAGVAG